MNTPVEALQGFLATNMGWLDPQGRLHPVALHDHLRHFQAHPQFGQAYDEYVGACEHNEAMMDADLSSLGPDDHPEMHRFDGMNDEARDRLLATVYLSGWIRLGMRIDDARKARVRGRIREAIQDPSNWMLEAEGIGYHTVTADPALRDLAAVLERRLVVREMSYEPIPMRQRAYNEGEKAFRLVATRG